MSKEYVSITAEEMDVLLTTLNCVKMDTPSERHELVYKKEVPGTNPPLEVRVFTTIQSGVSRDCGEDAIRIVLFDTVGKTRPVGGKKKVLRVPGWEDRLKDRIDELLEDAFTLKKCPDGHYLVVRRAKKKDITSVKCSDCGADMVVRVARWGSNSGKKFLGCSSYPTCKNTERYDPDAIVTKVASSKFLGCSHYPGCKYTEEYTGSVTDEDIVEALL